MAKTFAVNPNGPLIIYVRTDGELETLTFKTKRQADKKILQLIEQGYTFSPAGK